MDERTDGRMDIRTDRRTNGRTVEQTDGQTNGWTDVKHGYDNPELHVTVNNSPMVNCSDHGEVVTQFK